ncbi:hypothetical protein [Geobacillus vulcani]|uniref:hypothetical protein n=1 Tax=Geobacillus vulcani TaxID=135517 RepID=UPI0004DEDF71|nr:hypothetical protein [Geobacillus vulcani]
MIGGMIDRVHRTSKRLHSFRPQVGRTLQQRIIALFLTTRGISSFARNFRKKSPASKNVKGTALVSRREAVVDWPTPSNVYALNEQLRNEGKWKGGLECSGPLGKQAPID